MRFLRLIRWVNVVLVLCAVVLGWRFREVERAYPDYSMEAVDTLTYYDGFSDDPAMLDPESVNPADTTLSEYDRQVADAYQELSRFSDSLAASQTGDSSNDTFPDESAASDTLPRIEFQPDTAVIILDAEEAEPSEWPLLLYLFLSAALVLAGANSVNNALDSRRDRPQKTNPAASGDLTPRLALSGGVFLNIVGLLLAMMLGRLFFVFALAVSILLFLYNRWLRDIPFAGNLVVALCGGALFVYIGMYFGPSDRFFAGAIFAFLTHFAREMVKDVEDMEDDRAAGGSTVAVKYGSTVALRMAQPLVFVAILGIVLSVIQRVFPPMFLLWGGILALPPAVMAMLNMEWQKPDKASLYLKLTMLGGLVAMFLAA